MMYGSGGAGSWRLSEPRAPELTTTLVRTAISRAIREESMVRVPLRSTSDDAARPSHALERAVVLARGDAITAEDLPDQVLAPPGALHAPSIATVPGSLEDVERAHVQRVLAESATLEEAAASLGINPTTLWRKRKRWGLD
jgi:transcriptional regulator with GAF, ATPase, and Fis domain